MADYNIYIRTIGGEGGEGSAVKPFQTGGGDSAKEASQFISKAGAFLENPDSGIGMAKNAAIGSLSKTAAIGITAVAIGVGLKIGSKIVDTYNAIATPRTGDYTFAIKVKNAKTALKSVFTPISTLINAEIELNRQAVERARNEQNQLLYGGTIYSDGTYGRYL